MSTLIYNKENKLINEKSPYLLQHAHNPVDWFPWCEKAFEKAKKEDKLIFLSIGYSTCHWCHVMEKESFEDKEVAEILNNNFISIKVDREERPDIDNIYMTFCQAITGSGGWPLTVIITPDKKPFFAGTYFPKKSVYGKVGLIELLKSIIDSWNNKREDIIMSSNRLIEDIKKITSVDQNKKELEESIIEKVFRNLEVSFDYKFGGFGFEPKFPTPHKILFLLRLWKVNGNEKALNMAEKTLEAMYRGGIFDHVGFGFSRYSTDRQWLIPHFEKMLYDNALLAITYIEAYQITQKNLYKKIAEKILKYILRDMKSEKGAFYSAEDADSEGVEGKFYLWSIDEVEKVLGKKQSKLYCKEYNLSKIGNFEGKNIPNLISKNNLDFDKNYEQEIETLNKKLFDYREKRVHPHKDDKILTSWNSLMIIALAYGGRIFNNEMYVTASQNAMDFILKNLVREDNRLFARYREGEKAYLAYLDDYAFLIWALLELYETTFEERYLQKAIRFNKDMLKLFWDDENGGLFLYGIDGEKLILRPKEIYDGAIPSGNSVAVIDMIKIFNITGNNELKEKIDIMFKTFSMNIKSNPQSHVFFIIAFMYKIIGNEQIIIVEDKNNIGTKKMLKEINNRFLPFSFIILKSNKEKLEYIIPFIKEYKSVDGKSTAYICKNFSCNKPITNIDDFIKLL